MTPLLALTAQIVAVRFPSRQTTPVTRPDASCIALHQHGVVAELGAELFGVVAQRGAEGDVPCPSVTSPGCGPWPHALSRAPCPSVPTEPSKRHGEFAVASDDLAQPVDHVARFIGPQLHQIVVHEAVGIADDVLHGLHLVDLELRELLERLPLQRGVDGSQVLARRGDGAHLLDAEHLRAMFGSRDDGGQTARAAPHYHHVHVDGFVMSVSGHVGAAPNQRRARHLRGDVLRLRQRSRSRCRIPQSRRQPPRRGP